MSTIAKSFKIDDVLTNMTSVVLSDPTGTFGVKRTDNDAVVVADGPAMTTAATGVYQYEFTDPADDLTYEYYLEIAYGGETYWIQGTFAGPESTGAHITTLAECKTYAGVSGSSDDTEITAFRDAAEKAMELYAGRKLISTAVTEYMHGTGDRSIWTREPADSITSIHVSSTQTWNSASLISSDDYLQDGCRIEYLDHIWTRGRMNVRVIYNGGYSTMPADIKTACQQQVNWLYSEWQRAKKGLANVAQHSVLGWSQKFIQAKGLMPEVKALLDTYRPARL